MLIYNYKLTKIIELNNNTNKLYSILNNQNHPPLPNSPPIPTSDCLTIFTSGRHGPEDVFILCPFYYLSVHFSAAAVPT